MLVALIIIPILGSITIASVPNTIKGYDIYIRKIALYTSLVVLGVSFTLTIPEFNFVSVYNNVPNVESINNLSNLLSYKYVTIIGSLTRLGEVKLGLDGLSLIFVLLTTYLIPIAILSTWNTVTHNIKSSLISILIIESLLTIAFTSLDLICFYVSFEAVLIPLFIIVGLHGSTIDRTRASMLLFMYTLFGSFFMLLSIIKLLVVTGTSDMTLLSSISISYENQRWIWIGLFIGIAVKSPLVPLHGWLFRAHSESSLAGSILLAGIILKLATYAYLRMLIPILPEACEYFRPLALTVACFTLIHGSIATLRQVDTKVFVAYSSVGHMGLVILGLAAGTIDGIQGSILLSIAHGLISPALFIIVGGVLYDRYHSRIIRYFRGTGSFMPSMKVWFFLASVASMGTPGSLNWISELLCITGAFQVAPVAGMIGASSVLIGAIYTIWFYNQIVGGYPNPQLALTNDLTLREYTMLILLIVPAFILGIYPNIVINLFNMSTVLLGV